MKQLVLIKLNFENQYNMFLKSPMSLLYTEDVKSKTINAIRVTSTVLNNFPAQVQIRTVAQNLLAFLTKVRPNIVQILLIKAAVYEPTIQTIHDANSRSTTASST